MIKLAWKKIAEKGTIQSGKSKEFEVEGKKIAVFNQDGSIAPEGKIEGDIVECPLHFWHYNIKTGELLDYLIGVKLQKYEIDIKDDGIYIDI